MTLLEPSNSHIISIVIVNLNGRDYLERCLTSLLNQDYPADLVEIILVDNASSDDSLDLVRNQFPTVRIIENSHNTGFAPAVNQGAAAASGHYLALINNDAHADPGWLAAMVRTREAGQADSVACVGATLLDWDGQRIDFMGGGISFYGFGYQFYHRVVAGAVQLDSHDILFACGGAMMVDRHLFLELGGFDDAYFAYFEDIDFGWRLWVCGYRVKLAPDAVVYHRHHGVSRNVPEHQINLLLERNGLMTVLKNYDEQNLYRVLGPSLLMVVQRLLTYADDKQDIDWEQFVLRYPCTDTSTTSDTDETLTVSAMTLSYIAALRDVMQQLPDVWHKRQAVQARRKRSDSEIFPLMRYPMGPHTCSAHLLSQSLVEAFGLRDMLGDARLYRVLILSSDPLYENLAGPGIRVVEMARYLAQTCHVVLAAPQRAEVSLPGVTCASFEHEDQQAVESLVSHADVVIVQGYTLYRHACIETMHKIVVVDLYDPFHLESLEFFKHTELASAREMVGSNVEIINQQLRAGDFFLCASERQRDLWLGALSSAGRLSPEVYANDTTFRSLIDVVPFGLEPTPPQYQRNVMKSVVKGIGADDRVVLWGGGIWDWLDPLTVIRAMALVRQQRPEMKLFFMGHRHPNPADVPDMSMYDRAVALVSELKLEDCVLFNNTWVPYAERANYFLEADIGVSTHMETIETHFAFRTRLLDYIWAGLPMVVSAGDALADVVAEYGLGHVVTIGDVEGYAAALLALADRSRESYAAAFAAVRHTFAWPTVLAPLVQFCQHPRCAPDKHRLALLDTYRQRIDEIDAVIAQKNDHIAYLEGLIKKIESGRMMRLIQTADRLGITFALARIAGALKKRERHDGT